MEFTGETLHITEEGLELPDWLQGHVGSFSLKTPNVDGDLETTEHGLGTHNQVLASVPEPGDYNEELDEGQLALRKPGYPWRVYQVVDTTEEGDA